MSDLAVARRVLQAAESGVTRASFDRACLLLSRCGRIPGLTLSHRDFRVLLFLLGQKPGYFAHHKTIAEALDSSTTPIREALSALREAGLVFWELIPPHHALPTGQFSRTNVNRYWVNDRRLLSLLGAEDGEPATAPKSRASTQLNSGASSGKDPRSGQSPPSTPPKSEPERIEPAKAQDEAVSTMGDEPEGTEDHASDCRDSSAVVVGGSPLKRDCRPCRRRENREGQRPELHTPAELEPVLASWRKLKLGEPDGRSIRALVNRRNEGATLEQLEAAVVGAGVDDWIRKGRAKVPFAVVFASVASVERFAHEGRKILEKREREPRGEAEGRRKVHDCAKSCDDNQDQPQRAVAALFKPICRPIPAIKPPPTDVQLSARRAEAKAKLEAWSLENGNA